MEESRSISARFFHTPCLILPIFSSVTLRRTVSSALQPWQMITTQPKWPNGTNEVGSLAQYYNNSSKVDPKEKLSYIIMLLADQHNQEAILSPMAQSGTPPAIWSSENFMKENEFYSQLSTQKWFKKAKFIASKKIIASEIVHCMPASHTNHNNKTVVQLMTVLACHPITNSIDKAFI
jgi:hypothetical protein